MKHNYQWILYYKIFIICIVILFLSACSIVPVKTPVEKDKVIKQLPVTGEEKIEDEELKPSIIDILIAEAEKFSLQGNYQDALFIYNQAFSQAQEEQKPKIIFLIESVLSLIPSKNIEEFIEIKNIQIPRSLLLYWLGLNYAMEDNVAKSIEILELFLFQYPEHPYYYDAADLRDVMKKILFQKDTIGCLLPLTGKYAVFGQRALTGIQMAIQELSKKYSREFKLIIKDTKADQDFAIEAVRQLHQQNVAGIIGPLLNVNEIGKEAQKLEMPLIALTQKNDFPLLGDYLFGNFITPEMQVKTLGAYLFRNLGIKKVAILYPDERYGKKYMKLFWDIVDEYDGEVVGVESYDGTKTDFAEPIKKLTGEFFPVPDFLKPKVMGPDVIDIVNENQNMELVQAEPDANSIDDEKIQIDFEALFIPDSPSIVNMILPQLTFNDAKGMYLIGTNLWHHKSILQGAKGYNKRAVITDGFFENSQNPVTAQFAKNYESLFAKKPKFLEAVSYDTASILFTTAMDKTIDSRKKLKEALQGNRIFEGATGNTLFDADGISHRDLFLMTITKGKFVEISR